MKNFLRRIFGKKEIPNPKETPLSESDRKLLDALDEAGL